MNKFIAWLTEEYYYRYNRFNVWISAMKEVWEYPHLISGLREDFHGMKNYSDKQVRRIDEAFAALDNFLVTMRHNRTIDAIDMYNNISDEIEQVYDALNLEFFSCPCGCQRDLTSEELIEIEILIEQDENYHCEGLNDL